MDKDYSTAVNSLLLSAPFFGELALRYDHVVDDTIQTLCIGRRKIRRNREYFASLTPDQRVFAVAHEVGHGALMHLPMMQGYIDTGLGPDGQPYDHQLMNVACDFLLNFALVESKVGELKQGWCYDTRYSPAYWTPATLYIHLKQGGGAPPDPQDEHDPAPDDDGTDAVTPMDVRNAYTTSKRAGKGLGSLERVLDELTKPKVSPWAVLRRSLIGTRPGSGQSTWKRLQRHLIVRGIGAPSSQQPKVGRVGLVIDVSGSINDRMVALFLGHLRSILMEVKPKDILIYWVDHGVRRVDHVRSVSDLARVRRQAVPGGGGTDMPAGVRAAAADKCDQIVVLTDGYTPFCDSKVPTFWAITTAGRKSPYGVSLNISE